MRHAAGLRASLVALRKAVETAAPSPKLYFMANCPSGMGDDEGLIVGGDAQRDGEPHQRAPDETVAAFADRLLEIAATLGAPTVFIGVGPSRRKEIAAMSGDGLAVEIGGDQPSR